MTASPESATLRTILAGREDMPPHHHVPRHRHLHPYAIVLIEGRFDQVSYAGRIRVRAGDVLVQPTLDAHANRMPGGRGARILRLPWPDVDGLGGVFALADLDAIVRAAERDLDEATGLARAQCRQQVPRAAASDLPDLLAAELVGDGVTSLATWAAQRGVARETVARGFSTAFGVSARQFRAELKARDAWLRIVRTPDSLAAIAAAAGFSDQAHMTRCVRALTGAAPAAWRRDHRATGFRRARGAPARPQGR